VTPRQTPHSARKPKASSVLTRWRLSYRDVRDANGIKEDTEAPLVADHVVAEQNLQRAIDMGAAVHLDQVLLFFERIFDGALGGASCDANTRFA